MSALGGLAGFALGSWTVKALVAMAPENLPRLDLVRIDERTLAFAALITAMTSLLVGAAPGLQMSHRRMAASLTGAGSRTTRSHRLRKAFVVVQVGLALVLLICAGLLGRSFANLLKIDIGFNPEHVLTLDVQLPDASIERHDAFYAALLGRVRALPGVETAGAVFQRPLEHAGIGMDGTVLIEGQRTDLEFRGWERNPRVISNRPRRATSTPSACRSCGGARSWPPTRHGRPASLSSANDWRTGCGRDKYPIGKRLSSPGARSDAQAGFIWATVVGVVRDARYRGRPIRAST